MDGEAGVTVSGQTSGGRPVLATVAELAGVSVSTVSKVINGRIDVAPGTRARILKALEELGYESPVQRRARSAGPPAIELVHGMGENYDMDKLKGILLEAASEGVEVVLSHKSPESLHDANHEEWAQHMVESGRSGLILVTTAVTRRELESFRARNIPVVVIDPFSPINAGYASVGATNWVGGKDAVEHLVSLGHTRIAHLGGPPAVACSIARLHGYLAALMGHGIQARDEYIVSGDFGHESGVLGARQLLALDEPPTAVFAANDSMALGVMEEARRQGIRVPEDLSVVGFDGTQLCEKVMPRLTSVEQPMQEMGRIALRTLMRMARGDTTEPSSMELATKLVVRDSTAPPHP